VVPYPPLAEINSTFLATIVPWIEVYDQFAAKSVFEPADSELGRRVAETPRPWYPAAGFRRGKVNATAIRYSASKEDRDLFMGLVGSKVEVLNPIISKSGRGLTLLGQMTCGRSPGSALNRISIRWTINLIMNLIELVALDILQEINDATLWREAAGDLNGVLEPIVARRGLQDAYVVVDGTTTSPGDIDSGILRGKLFVKPTRPVEEIMFDLIITPTGVDFKEVTNVG